MNNHLYSNHYSQRGLTMVELMVALALGLFLTAGVLHLYAGSKSTNNTLQGIARIQENGRISIERLKLDLRMAGFMGCSNLGVAEPNHIVPDTTFPFNLESVIQGVNNVAAVNADNAVVGSDVLTIITASPADATLKVNMPAKNSDVVITVNPNSIKSGDTVVITDCENADVFVASEVTDASNQTVIKHKKFEADGTTSTANGSNSLSKAYRVNALILSVEQATYAVRDTGRTDASGNAILSLFKTPPGGTPVEMITGVEDMQITYGRDTGVDGSADVYDTAAAITGTQWGSVVSVRIALLVSSAADVGSEKRPYTFQGTLVASPPDNRMRREFTTTVNLRNRNS